MIVQALFDMTSDKLQQKVCKLFHTLNFVLYNISKLLSNPSGESVMAAILTNGPQNPSFSQYLRF